MWILTIIRYWALTTLLRRIWLNKLFIGKLKSIIQIFRTLKVMRSKKNLKINLKECLQPMKYYRILNWKKSMMQCEDWIQWIIGRHINKILHGLINHRLLQPLIGNQTPTINHTSTTSHRKLSSKNPKENHSMKSIRTQDSNSQPTPSPMMIQQLLDLKDKKKKDYKERWTRRDSSSKKKGTLTRIIIRGSIRASSRGVRISSLIQRPATHNTKK